jgi:hypothetical protein
VGLSEKAEFAVAAPGFLTRNGAMNCADRLYLRWPAHTQQDPSLQFEFKHDFDDKKIRW